MSESESLVERVADALRAACRKEYGSDWNNDVAEAFARAAIQAMRDLPDSLDRAGEEAIRSALDGDWCAGDKLGWDQTGVFWRAAIDAALA